MKIFYICYEDLSLQRASTTHIKEVTEHLKKSGNDVVLFAPDIGRYRNKTTVRVIYVPAVKVRFIKEYTYYLYLLFYLFVYQIRLKADVFYVREMGLSIAPALVGFVLNVPHVLEINGLVAFDLKGMGTRRLRHKIFEIFQHINVILADKVVSVSENIKNELLNIYKDPKKIVVIENGVNAELFCPKNKEEMRSLLKLGQGYYLIYAGSFYPHHGVHHIIHILNYIIKKLPDVKLIMVGSGYLLQDTINLTMKLGLTSHVVFTGEAVYEKIPDYINAADAGLFILTGIGTVYGRSLKLYEYMACGSPVITGESCGDFVRESAAGIVIPHEDYEHAADDIVRLLKDEAQMDIMGENGRKLILNAFTWDITIKKILKVCQAVI